MDAKGSFLALVCLVLLVRFQRPAAHPIHSLSPAEELADMELLLERLEEKVALMGDLRGHPEDTEPHGERQELDDANEDEDEPLAGDLSDRTALLKRLRGIQAAKSVRESGCFGRRLDRIGSLSGMGCKGSRRH